MCIDGKVDGILNLLFLSNRKQHTVERAIPGQIQVPMDGYRENSSTGKKIFRQEDLYGWQDVSYGMQSYT